MAESQAGLDGHNRGMQAYERRDAKRTEEAKATAAKAKKLRVKCDKDAAALQVLCFPPMLPLQAQADPAGWTQYGSSNSRLAAFIWHEHQRQRALGSKLGRSRAGKFCRAPVS